MADLTSASTAVLVHEDPLRMAAIERALREAGITVVGKAGRFDNALDLVMATEPDLLVLELDGAHGRTSAIELLRDVAAEDPDMKVIAFSTDCDPDRIDAALEAGAAAYVIDTTDGDELRAAVHQAASWVLAHEREADPLLS